MRLPRITSMALWHQRSGLSAGTEIGICRRAGLCNAPSHQDPTEKKPCPRHERPPPSCAAPAGSRPTICAASATARASCRWATRRRTGRGRPVIAILNTWSDINPCHAHFKQRVEDVKRGVLQAGGFPLELPALSLAETYRQADHHALPQHAGDGGGGAAALPSGRRRGADGRLRQDHAGAC